MSITDPVREVVLRAYLGRGLAEIFVGYGPDAKDAMGRRSIIVTTHQAPWDAGIALALTQMSGGEFAHLAAEHVVAGRKWLSALGLFSLPEAGDQFARLDAMDEAANWLRSKERFMLWLMPVQGHWRTRSLGVHSSIAALFYRALEDVSPIVLACSIAYVTFGFRKPVALVWIEVPEVDGSRSLTGRNVRQLLVDCDSAGWRHFRSDGPLQPLLHGGTIAIVDGLPVSVSVVEKAFGTVTRSHAAGVSVVDGRLSLVGDLDSLDLDRRVLERRLNGDLGPNLASAIVSTLLG